MKRTIAAALAGGLILTAQGVMAQSRATMTELCSAHMVDTYGEVEVTFGKYRREENRTHLYGEVAMADGSTRRVRCQVRRGKVRELGFGNAGGALGNQWSGAEPEADDFARPEVPPEEGQETAAQDPATPDADTGAVDAQQPATPGTPEADTDAPADGETAAADTPAEGEGAAAEPEEEVDPTAPRRMRVPQQ